MPSEPAEFASMKVTVDGHIATIELSRPEVLNVFDHTLHHEFPSAFTMLAKDPQVRVAVLRSTGRVFSAGGSTDMMKDATGPLPSRLGVIDDGRTLFRSIADFPKPLVVALEGDAYGLGATVAMMGDAIVSHPTVKIADTHVVMGLVAGDGGLVAWPMTVGMTVAKRHLLTGDPLSGQRAYDLGAVTDLAEDRDGVVPLAYKVAERMASLPPMAVQLTKRGFNKLHHARIEDGFDLGFYLEAMSLGTEDLHEAVAAFLERRKPDFKGQ